MPVNLPGPDNLQSIINGSGLKIIDTENYSAITYFPTALDLLRNLSSIGGTAVRGPRLSRSGLSDLCKDYEGRFGVSGGIPVSYRAILGTAEKE